MKYYPPSIVHTIRHIAKLPGIGEKTAERLTMHLLRRPRIETEQLAQSLLELKSKVRRCQRCYGLSDREICHLCDDPGRNHTQLCVVEHPADMISIEKSGAYNGLYHILNGTLSPMNGVGPADIRINELLTRIKRESIREIIVATSTTVEGESTAVYLADQLKSTSLEVTRIASGVPIGGDLKYIDQVTLKRAMEKRYAIE